MNDFTRIVIILTPVEFNVLTEATSMEWDEWVITSLDIPVFTVEPPPPFYDYHSFSQINSIDEATHEDLLTESLEIYDEIWSTLARM